MKRIPFLTMTLLALLAVGVTSCGKKQHLNITKGLLTFSYMGGSDCFQIEADCDWSVEIVGSENWCSLSSVSGTGNAVIMVTVDKNNQYVDRSLMLRVVSGNGRIKKTIQVVQEKIDINAIVRKVWYLRTYERWNTDYYDQYIEDSYRSWTYYSNYELENWFFYFMEDSLGVQIRTKMGDTIYYPYKYVFFPEGDSLYMMFQTSIDTTIEDYHVTVMALNNQEFVFSDEYRPHQFEKLNTVNVTPSRNEIKLNPKHRKPKPVGPLIPMK